MIGWLLLRLVIGEVGIIVGLQVPGVFGTATLVVGSVVLVYTTVLAAIVLSLRIEVLPGELHVVAGPVRMRHRLDGARMYRWRVAADARHFDTALGSFGIELGPGQLGDDPIDVVRLDPSATVTVIQAGSKRLAIAASHDARFVRALRAAGAHISSGRSPLD